MLYEGDATPDHEAIAAFGLQLVEEVPEHTECWPDNWLPFQVFSSLATQWNVGPSKAIGLRYEAIPVVLQMGGVSNKEHAQILQDLRVMEREALQLFNKS